MFFIATFPGSYIIVVILHKVYCPQHQCCQGISTNQFKWTMENLLQIRVVFGLSITHELICGINFMSWNCRNRSYRALGVDHDSLITLKIAMIYLDIYFTNIYINIWHLHFSARGSDHTNIINGLNTIHGYQSCVWYIACDIWKKIYTYGGMNLFHYFQPSRCPHVSVWKAFTKAHHLLINKSFRNMPIYKSRTLLR